MSNVRIYKSTAAEFVDDFFGGTKRSRAAAYEQGRKLLNSRQPLAGITQQFGDANRAAPTYSEGGPNWLQGGDADRIMKEAYREAIDIAQQLDVPIETFWVTGATENFEMQVCQSADRVTVFVLIPGGRGVPDGSKKAQASTWSFSPGKAAGRGAAPVVKTQVSGRTSGRRAAKKRSTRS